MRRWLSAAILALLVGQASAQEPTMRDVFRQMPDSLMPYLTQNDRLDFIDFIESDNNFAFSDLQQCLEELHTPDNLPLIDRNATFVESVERAVKLWELANDFLEIRNA